MNPFEVLLCVFGVVALALLVTWVDAGELAREGLPGVRIFLRPPGKLPPVYWRGPIQAPVVAGIAMEDSTPNDDGTHTLRVDLTPGPTKQTLSMSGAFVLEEKGGSLADLPLAQAGAAEAVAFWREARDRLDRLPRERPALEPPMPTPPPFPVLRLAGPGVPSFTAEEAADFWCKANDQLEGIAKDMKAGKLALRVEQLPVMVTGESLDGPVEVHVQPVDWTKLTAEQVGALDSARLLEGVPMPAPVLSREALTIQDLVIAAGGYMGRDELLAELADSFEITLTPEAIEKVAETIPDLEVMREEDVEPVFAIPPAKIDAEERRALEKYIHAGLVDLRRESAPATWDSFVESLPLAKKGEPKVKRSDRERDRALLAELHAWEKRAERTEAQLRALHEFGAIVEREAYPLRVVTTGSRPVCEEDREAVEAAVGDLSKVPVARELPAILVTSAFAKEFEAITKRLAREDAFDPSPVLGLGKQRATILPRAHPLTHAVDEEGESFCPYDPTVLSYVHWKPERVTCPVCIAKMQSGGLPAEIRVPRVEPLERHEIPLKQEPNGTWTGTTPDVHVREGETIATRVFVRHENGQRIAKLSVTRGERAPCSAGHPDTQDCPRCRGVQAPGGDMPPLKLIVPAFERMRPRAETAWSPDLGRSIASDLASTHSLSDTTGIKRSLLHVAEGRLVKPASSATEFAFFCQRLLGSVPDVVTALVPAGHVVDDFGFWVHFSPSGTQHSACNERYAQRFTIDRAEVTCPSCADTWTRS